MDSWSPGAGFNPILSTMGINQIKKEIVRKKSLMHKKRYFTFLKIWVQFRVGAIPRLPVYE